MRTVALPQSPVLSGSASWDDFGDENAGVFTNVRVIRATSDTEAQAWIPLHNRGEETKLDSGGTSIKTSIYALVSDYGNTMPAKFNWQCDMQNVFEITF